MAVGAEPWRSVSAHDGPGRVACFACWIVAVRAVLDPFRVGSSQSVLALARPLLRRAGPCHVVLSRVGGLCRVVHGSANDFVPGYDQVPKPFG